MPCSSRPSSRQCLRNGSTSRSLAVGADDLIFRVDRSVRFHAGGVFQQRIALFRRDVVAEAVLEQLLEMSARMSDNAPGRNR